MGHFEVDAEIRQTMPPQVDEVYQNKVFIGNFKGAQSFDLLKNLGITHVFNVAEGPGFGSCGVFDQEVFKSKISCAFFPFLFFSILEHDIEYHGMVIRDNVEASDSGQQQILFKKAADIIESSLQAKVCNILCLF